MLAKKEKKNFKSKQVVNTKLTFENEKKKKEKEKKSKENTVKVEKKAKKTQLKS